jgi:RHS repeat-associated protein
MQNLRTVINNKPSSYFGTFSNMCTKSKKSHLKSYTITYLFAFNGQERDDEVAGAGNIMTAEFWEYDARLGRRWNRDPISIIGLSPYMVFFNNPTYFVDPSGLSPEGNEIGPMGEGGSNGPGMMDDGNGHNEIPEESFRDGNMVNDPNSGKTPNPKDFKISAIGNWRYNHVEMNVNISVERNTGATTTIEGLQIIQIAIFPSNNYTRIVEGTFNFIKDKWTYYGFVDGGWRSPSGEQVRGFPYYYNNNDLYGSHPESSIIPINIDRNRRALYWDNLCQSGSIRAFDDPDICSIINIVSFETIVIGVNANCSGMDIILGSFQWGTENKGFDGTGSFGDKDVKVSLPAANRALKIIFNDYSVYKVW